MSICFTLQNIHIVRHKSKKLGGWIYFLGLSSRLRRHVDLSSFPLLNFQRKLWRVNFFSWTRSAFFQSVIRVPPFRASLATCEVGGRANKERLKTDGDLYLIKEKLASFKARPRMRMPWRMAHANCFINSRGRIRSTLFACWFSLTLNPGSFFRTGY